MIKTYHGRFVPKGDTEANWNKAVGFIPLDKEIIIYKPDETHSVARFKVGDGKTVVQELTFSGTDIEAIKKLIDEKGEILIEYVDNAVAAIPELQKKIEELENVEEVTIVSFSFPKEVLVKFDAGLPGMTKIDWGDGTVNNELSHMYKDGAFDCKIYGLTEATFNKNGSMPGIDYVTKVTLGNTVRKISNYAFAQCIDLGKVYIPNSVSHIGERAFLNCYSISSLELPSSIEFLGKYAFSGTSIRSLTLPSSITDIPDYLCEGCARLQGVSLPNTIISIGQAAFSGCSSLATLSIPNSVKIIKDLAFNHNSFTQLDIPDSVIELGDGLCGDSLEYIKLSNKITTLKGYVFDGCYKLKELVIPDSVTSLEGSVFEASKITNLYLGSGLNKISGNTFNHGYGSHIFFKSKTPIDLPPQSENWWEGPNFPFYSDLINIHVPKGTLEEYRNKWHADGASQELLTKIIEYDREAMMSDLDSKFDKTGGTISGDLSISGNLTVTGTTTTQDTETVLVKNNIVVTNSDGLELLEPGGFAIKTDETNAYGIMYDPSGDGVKIGLGMFNENGKFEYIEGEDQFLATRADTIADGHTVVWDDTTKKFVDSGVAHSEIVKNTDYATGNKAGTVRAAGDAYGISINSSNGNISLSTATDAELKAQTVGKAVKVSQISKAVKEGVVNNNEEWTDEEKAAACETIGAVPRKTSSHACPIVYAQYANGEETTYNLLQSPSQGSSGIPLYFMKSDSNGVYRYLQIPVGLVPTEEYSATSKKYVDELVYMSGELIRTADLWVPVHKEYTTISDTDGRTWNCDAVSYYNTRTNKHKVEYTLISTQEITANADTVAISVPLIGVNYTLGAKYRAATIAYSALPITEDDVAMGGEKFKQSYFTLDGFTWDEQTDIGNECTPLPFRGSGGFEVKVLTWTEDPVASITFKTIIAKVTKYEV